MDKVTGVIADRVYNIAVAIYNRPGLINVPDNCNGFTFTNTGNDTARVNGMVIYPGTPGTILGDSRSIGGNENEVYKGNIKLEFNGVGNAPAVEIIFKIYVK